jgi:hypothetical protein
MAPLSGKHRAVAEQHYWNSGCESGWRAIPPPEVLIGLTRWVRLRDQLQPASGSRRASALVAREEIATRVEAVE